MNRRELLASFLGIPLAMLGGCSLSTPRLPKGEFVGASAQLGHRIRDGARSKVADDAWESVDVVIVGGGVAGLSAARRLRQDGIENFVLLELEKKLGGTSVSGTSKLVDFPWGAHYLPAPLPHNKPLIELLVEMDVYEEPEADGKRIVREELLCRAPQERVFFNGAWYEGLYARAGASHQDLDEFEAFRQTVDQWVAFRDSSGKRAFTIPVSGCSRSEEVMKLDKLTMADWLHSQGWKSERLHQYVEYACKDDYGLTVEQTSAWAGLFYFVSRVAAPGKTSQPFIVWPEGNGRLVQHLRRCVDETNNDNANKGAKATSRLRSGWAVTKITPPTHNTAKKHADLIEVEAISHDPSKPARGWRAKRVVFAAPPFLAPFIIDRYAEDGPQSIREFQFGSWLVANLHLSDRPTPHSDEFPLSWDNVIYDSPALGYVVATHQKGIDYGPTILTYYYPLTDDDPKAARDRLLNLKWSEWADIVLTDLERAHPDIRSLTTRLDIMRWGHAMIRPVPGFVSSNALGQVARPFNGVHFAHSSLSGVALFEEAFDHGNRAATEVVQSLKADLS